MQDTHSSVFNSYCFLGNEKERRKAGEREVPLKRLPVFVVMVNDSISLSVGCMCGSVVCTGPSHARSSVVVFPLGHHHSTVGSSESHRGQHVQAFSAATRQPIAGAPTTHSCTHTYAHTRRKRNHLSAPHDSCLNLMPKRHRVRRGSTHTKM